MNGTAKAACPVPCADNYCCPPDSGDCCGPGSWCCARAGAHSHEDTVLCGRCEGTGVDSVTLGLCVDINGEWWHDPKVRCHGCTACSSCDGSGLVNTDCPVSP